MNIRTKILVVDDEPAFREILREVLESKGYVVYEAGDGEQALTVMNKVFPDMAVVDLDMPKMNGIEFSKKVKAAHPRFPIVMVTAYAQFYSPAEILAAGIDAFLQKPIDMTTFLKAIERL
jgi:CheY-like chemotaxis protein